MRLQTTSFLLVASLFHYGDCVASDACVDGIRCITTGFTYQVYENAECTGIAIGNSAVFTCPRASPNCFGSRVGVTPATSTVPGTGPCLPAPPPCTAAGNFSIDNAAGARACRAFYVCSADVGAVGITQVCPVTGQEFNAATRVCEAASSANCSIPMAPECTGWGRLADPASCQHYYRCGIFGGRTRRRCPLNLRFDTDANACRRNAPCANRPLV